MNKARMILLAAILIVAVVFVGLYLQRSTSAPSAKQSVQIATFSTAIDYAPYYVARKLGYFDEALAPLHVQPKFTTFESLPPLNDSLHADQLDVVFEAEPPALIAEAGGTDVFVPAVSAILRQQIIVRKDSGIKDVAGLAGKSIGVLTGTSSHYGLVDTLKRAGLSVDQVKIVNLAPAEARAAFEAGRIDAWAIWPPFPEVEMEAGRAVALPGSEAPIVSMIVMRGAFAKQDPKIAAAIEAAIQRAKDFIRTQPDRAMQIVAESVREPIEVVRRAWPQHDFNATVTPGVVDQVQRTAEFLTNGKYLTRRVDAKVELFSAE